MSVKALLSKHKSDIKRVLSTPSFKSEFPIKDTNASLEQTGFIGNAFEMTIDTTKAGSANNTFILPTDNVSVYDYYIDWGKGGVEHITANTSQTHVYTSSGTYQIKIIGTFPRIYFNNTGDKRKLMSIDNWGDIEWGSFEGAFRGCSNMDCTATDSPNTSNVTTFSVAFASCSSLTALDVSGWDTSSVTSFEGAFYGCTSLISLDMSNWDVSSVETFYDTFMNCSSLVNLNTSGWDTSSVISFRQTFQGCSSLITFDTSGWGTSSVTSFNGFCWGCSSLEIFDTSGWDTSSVTSFDGAFYGCSSLITLDVSDWDISSATSFGSTFRGCSSLTTLDVSLWNISAGTSFYGTFYGCSALISLDVSNWNVLNITSLYATFHSCSSLTSLDVSDWDTSAITNFNFTFRGCSLLKGSFAALDLDLITDMDEMFLGCDINDVGTVNYDATLISWAAQTVKPNVDFHAGNSKYSAGGGGTAARAILTGAPNNWTIYDGGEA